MARDITDVELYVIVDPEALPEGQPVEVAAGAALRGGAGALQLRDKRATSRQLVERARLLAELCSRHDALLIINDRLDVALAAGADGVHLGPEDVPVELARRIAPDLILGGSAGTLERALELEAAGADYLGVGALYDAHPSKPDASTPRGPEALAPIVGGVSLPIFGIGGIDEQRAPEVIERGAAGVAVIRAVIGRPDPEQAARRLLQAIARAR